jgi:integrase
VTLNATAVAADSSLVSERGIEGRGLPLQGATRLSDVETMSTRVKTWCQDVGLKGNYGSHTLRKTWGYWQRLERGTAIPLLMEAFGHATQQQTLAYLGIQSNEIAAIYELEL